jgi:hypothetical protein
MKEYFDRYLHFSHVSQNVTSVALCCASQGIRKKSDPRCLIFF